MVPDPSKSGNDMVTADAFPLDAKMGSAEPLVVEGATQQQIVRQQQQQPAQEKDMVHDPAKDGAGIAVGDWGYPGHLTKAEWMVFVKFRDEVYKRGDEFRSTLFSFNRANEDETYAMCRWLRARKYDLADTIQMIEEATDCRSAAGCRDFFPDGHVALGVEPSIYHTQYPQMYYGFAKGGYPLFVSKVGQLNAEGLECVTTLQGILNYHWHDMMHSYVKQLRRQSKSDPAFKRYEVVCIIDLEGLTTSHLTKRALDIVKVQSEVDSLCFPETLHKLVIINAPTFFAMTWKVIRNWVDARTAEKVSIIGNNRSKWMGKLRELVDDDNLPMDYGGSGECTDVFLEKETIDQYTEKHSSQGVHQLTRGDSELSFCPKTLCKGKIIGQKAFHFSVRSSASHHTPLLSGESMELSVFTRSLSGGTLFITTPTGKKLSGVPIRHRGKGIEEEEPTRLDVDLVLTDAGRYKFKIESNAGIFGTEEFLVVGRLFCESQEAQERHQETMIKNILTNGTIQSRDDSESSSEGIRQLVDVSLCQEFCANDVYRKSGERTFPLSPVREYPNGKEVTVEESRQPQPHEPEQWDKPEIDTEYANADNQTKIVPSSANNPAAPRAEALSSYEDEEVPRLGLTCGAFTSEAITRFFSSLCGVAKVENDSSSYPHTTPTAASF